MIYAIWAFLYYKDIDTINCMYVYVEHNKENSYIYKRNKFDEYKQTIQSIIDNIENDINFNKNEIKLCDYCNFRKFKYCI